MMRFKEIVQSLNAYVESKDYKFIDEIENSLKPLFSIEFIKFIKYNSKDDTLQFKQGSNDQVISLESSITKQAIDKKRPIIAKHIISDKNYYSAVDNPLELKIKSLLVFPVLKNNRVIGVLQLTKDIKQNTIFNKKDEVILEAFMPLLIKIIEEKSIDKEELHLMMGESTFESTIETSEAAPVVKPVKKSVVELKNRKDDTAILNMKALQKEIASLKDNLKALENEIKSNDIQKEEQTIALKLSEKKYEELLVSSLSLSDDIKEYQGKNKELLEKIDLLKIENKRLSDNKDKSIQTLKAEHSRTIQNKFLNIEDLLHSVFTKFSKNEHAYILFELMVYAFQSKTGINSIEKILYKSKILPELMSECGFKDCIRPNTEKEMILNLSDTIEKYGKHIFESSKINISISENIPTSLVFDTAKIKSIFYHLLMDLYQFADHTQDLNININYENKFLIISVDAKIYKSNNLLKSMFKQSKLVGNEKDRMGLLLSKKLVESLKGNIESMYDDKEYKFVLSIPTQIIKM